MHSLWLNLGLAAMAPVVAAADAPQTSVQQDFLAAQALSNDGKLVEALAAWDRLEQRIRQHPRNLAIVRLRKGQTLYALDRRDEAVDVVTSGLALLPGTDPTLREDRYLGYMLLGKVAETSLNYATAADDYRQADAIAERPDEHLPALRGLAETETFVDSDAAVTALARAQAAMAAMPLSKQDQAEIRRVESQLKLNRGDFTGARAAAGEGVKLLGGLTSRTDLADVRMRSDYAIAAMLLGDRDDARRYMAMTGAGRLSSGKSFDPAVQMSPPDCGGDSGLRPDDTAVVEFSIGDDGSVIYAAPVYATRGGKVALEFARAVRNWSWTPEQVKLLPRFFRYSARIELRCSSEFAKPSLVDYLDRALSAWLAEQGIDGPLKPDGADAALLPGERSRLAALEKAKGTDSLALVPALHILARNSVVARDETAVLAGREAAILAANRAPAMARLSADITKWQARRSDSWGGHSWARELTAAVTTGIYADDPQARALLRLMIADTTRSFDRDRVLTLLDQVTNDSALAADDDLKVGAWIRKASIYTRRGDATAARAAYAQTRLDAHQCSLVDTAPRLIGAGGAFPTEAKAWGFEGWVAVQFDIGADGHTLNQRAVASYPPFIFTKAGDAAFKTARYEKSFRPGGGLGCGGVTRRAVFLMGN